MDMKLLFGRHKIAVGIEGVINADQRDIAAFYLTLGPFGPADDAPFRTCNCS